MPDTKYFDQASSKLARRALLLTLSLALAGGASGLIAALLGLVASKELALIVCSMAFAAGTLAVLLFIPSVTLQSVATLATIFFTANLVAGMLISICGSGRHLNLFVYLLWFFPLLVFNKLVNEPNVGGVLAKVLQVTPFLILLGLVIRLLAILALDQQILLGVFCLSYGCYGLTFNTVTRYRERYIAERERAESLRGEAEVLESISDCFVSLNSDFQLTYLNKAACAEFGIDQQSALHATLSQAAPLFFTDSMLNGVREAVVRTAATIFEAPNVDGSRWYELCCFPRKNGISINFREVTERRVSQARIQYLAFHDVLTGLPNRQLLRDRLAHALESAASRSTRGALLYLDLDDFKTVNDTMGHYVGDALLKQAADRLVSCVRAGDVVARLGGDEFVVMLEGLSEDPQAATAIVSIVGHKLLDAFSLPFILGTYETHTTASIGATLFTGKSETVDNLLKRTDLALYQAKAAGRNVMRFFYPVMQTDVDDRAARRADLRRALQYNNGARSDEFELHYQAQVGSDDVVCGAEALVRWQHPLRGRVFPNEFIPLAEEAGLIVELGRWVLETACLQLAKWALVPAMEKLVVSVNVSVRQILDPEYVHFVKDTLRISGANPLRLKLEITESSLADQMAEVVAKMNELKVYGIGFSLDDFGTGYSSLSYLRHLPLDQLKIDRSFVNNVLTDAKDASIARTIIALGHSLNLSVIAEGVETKTQRDFLSREGCHLYQGFLYSQAIPGPRFEDFVIASAQPSTAPGELSVCAV